MAPARREEDMELSQEDEGSDVDMQVSEEEEDEIEPEDEEEVDVVDDNDEGAEDELDEDDAEGVDDKDVDVEEEDEQGSDVDALSTPPDEDLPTPKKQPRLRIKLKLPRASATSTAGTTPDEPGPSRRRAVSRGSDIESEDEYGDDAASTRSDSVAVSTGRLTARQAVLKNVVDSSHVALAAPPNPRKKKPLNEDELALKREETARKRKNLSEKRLENEKAETINRLLKKQSRPRGKRNALATAEDRPTAGAAADAEGAEEVAPELVLPTTYRWMSSTRPAGPDGERTMKLAFAVPAAVLPPEEAEKSQAETPMEVDGEKGPAQCDVSGCAERRKYRLVRNWKRGACGIGHLKLLEAQAA